jgi:hypothetical protein
VKSPIFWEPARQQSAVTTQLLFPEDPEIRKDNVVLAYLLKKNEIELWLDYYFLEANFCEVVNIRTLNYPMKKIMLLLSTYMCFYVQFSHAEYSSYCGKI